MRRRGARTTFCVYYLLIIFVRRPVFYRYRITIKYTKKRRDCIIEFHVNVFYFPTPLLSLLVGQGHIGLIILDYYLCIGGLSDEFLTTLNI